MTFLTNPLARIGAAIGVFAAAALLVWALVLRGDIAIRHAAEAKASAAIATAQAGATQDTLRITVDHQNEVTKITQRTTETNHEILTAPGAGASVDPAVHRAGLRALCLQNGRRDRVCAEVLQPDGGQRATD